jgi:hypothetical protein
MEIKHIGKKEKIENRKKIGEKKTKKNRKKGGEKRGGEEQHNKKTIKETKNTERKQEKWILKKKIETWKPNT